MTWNSQCTFSDTKNSRTFFVKINKKIKTKENYVGIENTQCLCIPVILRKH